MHESPEFLIDRSLGRRHLADALSGLGLTVHTLASVYGERAAQELEDERWLVDAGQHDWVVLMKDDNLEQLEAPEVVDEIAELPFKVGDHVVGEAVVLLRIEDLTSEGAEQLVSIRARACRLGGGRLSQGRDPDAGIDLLQDPLHLAFGSRAVPSFVASAKSESVARTGGVNPRAEGDRPAVLPQPLGDLTSIGPAHHGRRSGRGDLIPRDQRAGMSLPGTLRRASKSMSESE